MIEYMKSYYIAKIEWVSFEKGGRRVIPPIGTRYCPLIMLDDEKEKKWSIDFVCPDFNKTDLIEFSFLVDGAPTEKIILKKTYDLYEGKKKVAKLYIKKKSNPQCFV